ncbi:hypothetical protein [Streptomyces sp. WAC01280]|uniref:hypothetical protein n=1 Tax=Streptomyces sp. WAC01280 TaxID=2487424 RepID=UPI000F766F7A|nr:hypothetical protein [Streptomyces sp. WAC01280]RSS50500.1 hypothetical protein EF909_37525 [Streptomyces sp. WAC01280]
MSAEHATGTRRIVRQLALAAAACLAVAGGAALATAPSAVSAPQYVVADGTAGGTTAAPTPTPTPSPSNGNEWDKIPPAPISAN